MYSRKKRSAAECEKLKDVQGVTDDAAEKTKPHAKWLTATQYGTRVHYHVAEKIGNTNPDFKAENITPEIL